MVRLVAPRGPVTTVGPQLQGEGHAAVMNGNVYIGVCAEPLEVDCELGLEGASAWTDVVNQPDSRGQALNSEKEEVRHAATCGSRASFCIAAPPANA